jgi:hypothetical protein
VIPGLTHEFEITSPLTRTEAMAAMERHIEPIKWFRVQVRIGFWTVYGDRGTDKFEGEMTPDGFIAQRIMGYGNFCPPRSTGKIMVAGRGSAVSVRMMPTTASYAIPGVILLAILWGIANPRMAPDITALAIAALLLVVWLAAFWFEAIRQEATLRTIFHAS